jgi:hypothetical protein
MLTVLGSVPVRQFSLKIDEYVPFSFRCMDITTAAPLYWRTGDFKQSLIEVGLDPVSGVLCTIKVPLLGQISLTPSRCTEPSRQATIELPVCDWPKNRFKDEPCDLHTTIGNGFVSIQFTQPMDIEKTFQIDRLAIHVSPKGEICGITFFDLTEDELTMVGVIGIEPTTFPVSRGCSPAELHANI